MEVETLLYKFVEEYDRGWEIWSAHRDIEWYLGNGWEMHTVTHYSTPVNALLTDHDHWRVITVVKNTLKPSPLLRPNSQLD